jgi:signal transduction histidine kinase
MHTAAAPVPPVTAPSTPGATGALGEEVLHRLLRAVRDLAACRDVDAVARVVRSAARQLVDADGATFVLRNGGSCWYVAEDAVAPLWTGQRFPLETCVSGWAMLNEQQAVIPDIYLDPRVPHDAYRPTFVKSLVMTPVRSGGGIGGIAAIGTYWAQQRLATPVEQEVLQALADSTAVALENVRTLEDLEARVAGRTAEIEASNRDLAAFAQVAAHDLKAPLTTILGHSELMSMESDSHNNPVLESSLGAVHRQALRMTELIDGVLSYSTAATSDLAVEQIDLDDLVAEVLRDLATVVERASATVSVTPDLPRTVGSRALLERVVQNLMANAIAYGRPGGPRVEVAGRVHGGWTEITVCDNGAGVPEGERESIFDMFLRGSTSAGSAGSGIGLAFARRVLVRHGGSLEVDDAPGGGARFTVRLPLDPAG